MKIAVFSSADSKISKKNKILVKKIAQCMFKYNITLVTGGSLGIPGFLVEEYKKIGGKTIMYSPDSNQESHNKRHDNHDLSYYNHVYFGKGFTERSLNMINEVDGAIALNGRTGTLCEMLIAIEEQVPLVVFNNAGGVCKHFKTIIKFTHKTPVGFLEIKPFRNNSIKNLICEIKN